MLLVAPQAETETKEKASRNSKGDVGAQPSLLECLLYIQAGMTTMAFLQMRRLKL